MTENQQKMAIMAGALLMGATSAYYISKRAFGRRVRYEEPDLSAELAQVTLPAIVSDIDGVVILSKDVVPGSKEALEKVLSPLQKQQRYLPFTFLSNGGGYSEHEKAEKMNAQIGLGGGSFFPKFFGGSAKAPKLTENEIVLCHTILRSESIQKRFANEWVLVDGFASDDAKLAMSYGFKKVISLKELMSVETTACPWIGVDFYESKLSVLRCRNRLLKRFGMTMEELRAQLKFKAIIVQCCTVKVMSLVQALCDIVCSKDGSLHGEPLGPSDPQGVAVITTNPDMLFASDHPSPRFGPRVVELCLNSVYREKTGKDLIIEQYGKPHETNFRFVEEYLTTLATKRAIKISNFYMIGDNPESDIAGGNGVGWITILVRSGVFKPANYTSIDGNDKKNPATHVVENFKEAIELIFRLENL